MKYCKYCGQQLYDTAAFCSRCGKATDVQVQPVYSAPQKKNTNVICILGFIFSLLGGLTVVGLILSIVGYNQVKNTDANTGKTLSKAGITVRTILIGLIVFIYIIVFAVIFALV